MPNSPTRLKARLGEALARVESLEREMQNAKARERRAKKTVQSLLEDLKEKNLININEELCPYLGSTLQKPNLELRTIISCLFHLWCLNFTK